MKTRILVLLLCTSLLAHAHAFLDHAEPPVGATVQTAPAQVKIWFTEELKNPGSDIAVSDSAGHEVDHRDSRIDSTDKTLMVVPLPPLPPGTYKVTWHAVAWDTHHTKGTFEFTVAGPK